MKRKIDSEDEDDFAPIWPRPTDIGMRKGDIISDTWPDSSTTVAVDNANERRTLEEYEGDEDRYTVMARTEPRPRNKRLKESDIISEPTPEKNAAVAVDKAGESPSSEEYEADEDNDGWASVIVDEDGQSCSEASAESETIASCNGTPSPKRSCAEDKQILAVKKAIVTEREKAFPVLQPQKQTQVLCYRTKRRL